MKLAILILCVAVVLGTPCLTQAQTFNRTSDVVFGAAVSGPVGLATKRPWIGLVVGLAAAGIDDGYKMHDSTIRMSPGTAAYHMSLMGAGSLAGYGLGKLQRHLDRKRMRNIYVW